MTAPHAPSRDDGVVRALSEVVGGPLGRHAGHHPWWTPLRVALAVTAVVLAAGLLAKVPCVDASTGDARWPHSRVCHSEVAEAYVAAGFAELTRPWTDDAASRARHEAPGLAAVPGFVAWGTTWLTHGLTGSPDVSERYRVPTGEVAARDDVRREVQVFTAFTAVLLAGLGLLATWLLAGVGRDRPWSTMAWAASPVLLLMWPVGWDLLGAVAVAGALAAHARGRPVLTGVLVGLGASVVPHVAVLLVALGVLAAVRRTSAWDAVVSAVAAVLGWALVNVPAWAAGSADWAEGAAGAFGAGPDLGSVWLLAEQASDREPPAWLLWVVAAGVMTAWTVAVAVAARRARRTPSLAEVALLLLVGLFMVAPAHPPTHALLLLPLAAVAVPRWRDLLVWQCGELLHLAMTGFYVGGALAPASGGDSPFYWLGILVRVAAELWLAGAVLAGWRRPDPRPRLRPDPPDRPGIVRDGVVGNEPIHHHSRP